MKWLLSVVMALLVQVQAKVFIQQQHKVYPPESCSCACCVVQPDSEET
jgi:hypothetical protein